MLRQNNLDISLASLWSLRKKQNCKVFVCQRAGEQLESLHRQKNAHKKPEEL